LTLSASELPFTRSGYFVKGLQMQKAVGWAVIAAIFFGISFIFSSIDKFYAWKGGFDDTSEYKDAKKLDISTKIEYDTFRNNSCEYTWQACTDNGDLVNNYEGIISIQSACKIQANALAKYSTEWGWTHFGIYNKGKNYIESGVVTLFEREAKFENGFGAMKVMNLECRYNLKTNKVIYLSEV
jgi:hypothetical protein